MNRTSVLRVNRWDGIVFRSSPFHVLACLCGVCAVSTGRAAVLGDTLDLIREKAASGARAIHSLEFTYVEQWNGEPKFRVNVFLKDDRFRINRYDIMPTSAVGSRGSIGDLSSAYDGRRQQELIPQQTSLRLKDGPSGAMYGAHIPQAMMYLWMLTNSDKLAWDRARNPSVWSDVLKKATYVGRREVEGIEFEVVDIPQPDVKPPAVFHVYFAPKLGFVPLRYERIIKDSRKTVATMRVVRHRAVEVDGQHLAIPLEMTFEQESGTVRKMKIVVDESSLKVNQDIDDAQFVIQAPGDIKIRDVDLYNRTVRQVEEANFARLQAGQVKPGITTSHWLLWLNVAIAFFAVLYLFWRRRGTGHT